MSCAVEESRYRFLSEDSNIFFCLHSGRGALQLACRPLLTTPVSSISLSFYLLVCLIFVLRCNGQRLFSQMAALGSTAGRQIRRATAARSCAPADPMTHPPLAEHRPPTDGLTDKWKHQKPQNNVFSSRIRHIIAASIQFGDWFCESCYWSVL